MEGERIHHIQVSRIVFTIEAKLCEGGISKIRDLLVRRDVVEMNLISSTRCSITALGPRSNGINGRNAPLIGLPGDGSGCTHLPLGALVDPELEQAQFLGPQVFGANLVLGGRHFRLLGMGGNLKEKAFSSLSGFHVGTIVVAFPDVGGSLQHDVALGTSAIVTGETIAPKNRQNLVLKVNGLAAFDFLDVQASPIDRAEERKS